MSQSKRFFLAVAILSAMLSGCQSSDDKGRTDRPASAAASGKPAPAGGADAMATSPGKPTAPVSIEYSVVGTALVGQPVAINLRVSPGRADQEVTLQYRINDSSAMLFPESQAQRIALTAAAGNGPRTQQVTVVPQREGRMYLNVSAEVETENGTMFRSVAIPIMVGRSRAAPAVNGEIRETAGGETVISMPASEDNET